MYDTYLLTYLLTYITQIHLLKTYWLDCCVTTKVKTKIWKFVIHWLTYTRVGVALCDNGERVIEKSRV